MVKIKVKKLHPDAKLPLYAKPGDAGMDIFSYEDVIIYPGKRHSVSTGVSIALPIGYVSLIWDKSGIALNGLTKMAGVIDSEYRGEYKILLLNVSDKPYEIKKGQKVAQILIQEIVSPEIEEVEELDMDTSRGTGGFGSTGLH
ncbi:MAG: dUTP diphosphatase [Nanoarchaeota archaeon]|jgi:dUTP pyrophosphatase|nr:dUTP diphosphatase [Nanoarchaeota archaeon]